MVSIILYGRNATATHLRPGIAPARLVVSAFAALVLTGCASAPADLGRSDISAMIAARGFASGAQSAEPGDEILAGALSEQAAIRLALVNNPGLQASYARLGFAAADIYAAGRVANPRLEASLLDPELAGAGDQLTLGLAVSFTDLLTIGARGRLADEGFAALKQTIGNAVLRTAGHAQQAHIDYVAAQQIAVLRARIAEAGGLSAALAERFFDAGNLSPRELAIARATQAEMRLQALDAKRDAYAARVALAQVLGVSAGDAWVVDGELALPADEPPVLIELLARAADMRLDLSAAYTRAELLAARRGIVNWTRWLGDVEVGFERERETDGSILQGPTLALELPVFNQHKDELLRADADVQIAVAETRRLAIAVDNEVRLAWETLDIARDRVQEYRDTLIPQRIATVQRAQEEFNFMLIGVFELISLKQQEYDSYQGYLEAVRDYWLARSALAMASGAALPVDEGAAGRGLKIESLLRPDAKQHDHGAMPGKSDNDAMNGEPDHDAMHREHDHDAMQAEPDHDAMHDEHQHNDDEVSDGNSHDEHNHEHHGGEST